jgi:hypothetical protein
MTVDDRTRTNLHRKLEAVLGPEEADTLMAHLPPVTWQDVATKDDVRTMAAELRGEMGELRGEMGELRGEMGALRGELGGEISRAITQQTRWLMAFICAWSTVVLAAARLPF